MARGRNSKRVHVAGAEKSGGKWSSTVTGRSPKPSKLRSDIIQYFNAISLDDVLRVD